MTSKAQALALKAPTVDLRDVSIDGSKQTRTMGSATGATNGRTQANQKAKTKIVREGKTSEMRWLSWVNSLKGVAVLKALRTAPAERRALYFRAHRSLCQIVATKQAKANRSDPYTYNRVMSHFMNGLPDSLDDYMVEFRTEEVTIESPSGGKLTATREVPFNQKVVVP